MPAWIPVCRHRVGCARIKKAISEHGAFQHAGARFRTRGVSERLSGVSGRLAFRNGFWAFRDGWRSGTAFGVPGWLLGVLARVSAVPERRAVRNGWRRARDGRPAFRNGQAALLRRDSRAERRSGAERLALPRHGFDFLTRVSAPTTQLDGSQPGPFTLLCYLCTTQSQCSVEQYA